MKTLPLIELEKLSLSNFERREEKNEMGIKIEGKIEKVNGKELSYSKYMEKNQPVLLTSLMEDWRACRDWVTQNNNPNLQFFATHFGKSKVQDSAQEDGNASTEAVKEKSLLYLKDWHFVNEYPESIAYTTPMFFL